MFQNNSITLEQIRLDHNKYIRTRGLDTTNNPRSLLLSMMSDIGELSEVFQYSAEGSSLDQSHNTHHGPSHSTGTSLSDRESRQVGSRMADIVFKILRMSQQLGIDIGDAIQSRQDQLNRQHPAVVLDSRQPSQPMSLTATPLMPSAFQKEFLSSDEAFWELVKLIESYNTPNGETITESQFAAFDLRFVIPSNGREIELIPSGRTIPVTLATKQRFTKLAREKKIQIDNGSLGTSGAGRTRTSPQLPPAVPMSPLLGIVPSRSPPQANLDDSLLMRSANTHKPIAKESPTPASIPDDISDIVLQPVPVRSLSPKSVEKFWMMIDVFEKVEFSAEEIEELKIAFVIPHQGKHVELVPNGSQTFVTSANKREFIRLAREKARELTVPPNIPSLQVTSPTLKPANVVTNPQSSHTQQQQGGLHVKRGLTRSLSVHLPSRNWNPQLEKQHFSPSHFKIDLFSPFCDQTTFDVETSSTLAPVPESQPPTAPLSPDNAFPFTTQRRLVPPLPLNDDTAFSGILRELKNVNTMFGDAFTPRSFASLGLSFTVPHSGRVIELFPGGSNTTVTLARREEFIGMAEEKIAELNRESGAIHSNA